ncbi:MAG: hypothetical protein M1827_000339 [Pycnora praestabilis]|nr:MAG: hypothetical protein M1827_000339 [Pycnora praestabilis]
MANSMSHDSSSTPSTTNFIPIAQLSPQLDSLSSRLVKTIVTVIWPYSSSTHSLALLLAEPDFRLRRQKGQVRVQFSGASAKALARSGIASGDEVILSLQGARLSKDQSILKTPGKGVGWELKFEERVLLQIYRDNEQFAQLDVNHPTPSPEPHVQSPTPPRSPTPPPIADTLAQLSFNLPANEWSLPAFLKRTRTSSSSLYQPTYDPFAEEDGFVVGKGRKRTKFGRQSGDWKFEAQTPSPEKEEEADVALKAEPQLNGLNEEGVVSTTTTTLAPTVSRDIVTGLLNKADIVDEDPQRTVMIETTEAEERDLAANDIGVPFRAKNDIPIEMNQFPQDMQLEVTSKEQSLLNASVDQGLFESHAEESTERPRPTDSTISNPSRIYGQPSTFEELMAHAELPLDKDSTSLPEHMPLSLQLDTDLAGDILSVSVPNAPDAPQSPRLRTVASPGLPSVSPFMDRKGRSLLDSGHEHASERSELDTSDATMHVAQDYQTLSDDEDDKYEDETQSYSSLAPAAQDSSPTYSKVVPRELDDKTIPGIEETIADIAPLEGHRVESVDPIVNAATEARKQAIEEDSSLDVIDLTEEDDIPTPNSDIVARDEKEQDHEHEVKISIVESLSDDSIAVSEQGMSEEEEYENQIQIAESEEMSEGEQYENQMKEEFEEDFEGESEGEDGGKGKDKGKEEEEEEEEIDIKNVHAYQQQLELLEEHRRPFQTTATPSDSREEKKRTVDDHWKHATYKQLELLSEHRRPNEPTSGFEETVKEKKEQLEEVHEDKLFKNTNQVHSLSNHSAPPRSTVGSDSGILEETEEKGPNEKDSVSSIKPIPGEHFEASGWSGAIRAPDAIDSASPRKEVVIVDLDGSDEIDASQANEEDDDSESISSMPSKQWEDQKNRVSMIETKMNSSSLVNESMFEENDFPQNGVIAESVAYPTLPADDAGTTFPSSPPVVQDLEEVQSQYLGNEFNDQLITPIATQQPFPTPRYSPRSNNLIYPYVSLHETKYSQEITEELPLLATPLPSQIISIPHKRGTITSSRRKSDKLSSDVPEVISPWFAPKLSSQQVVDESESDSRSEIDHVVEPDRDQLFDGNENLNDRETVPFITSYEELLISSNRDIPKTSLAAPSLLALLPTGLRTPLSYFAPLSTLDSHFASPTDVLAVVTSYTDAERSKSGPRDYYMTMYITDPSSSPAVASVQLFRPFKEALPISETGDAVLLRNFKVVSRKRKLGLLSTGSSAWAIFAKGKQVQIHGPPLEFGAEERGFAKGLLEWWGSLGEDFQKHLEAAGHPPVENGKSNEQDGKDTSGIGGIVVTTQEIL